MNSQESAVSTNSVPPEIIDNQDLEFVDEIANVDNLYFANTETYELSSVAEPGESDSDNDDENSGGILTDASGTGEAVGTGTIGSRDDEGNNVYEFRLHGCACSKIYGHPCSEEIIWDKLLDFRNSSHQHTKDELNLVIKVQLLSHRQSGGSTDSKTQSQG